MRPLIAIIGTVEDEFLRAKHKHCENILKAGGLPAIFTPEGEPEDIVEVADGILLVSGPDVHPRFYGEDPTPALRDVDITRDEFEIKLAKRAVESEVPILGIGRGMHIINVALGGTLYQDVYEIPKAVKHDWEFGKVNPSHRVHQIRVKANTKLYSILKDVLMIEGTNEAWTWVNSFHHQAVKRLGEGLRQVAFAADGLIEGIESRDESFVIGIQWWPEYLPEMTVLYRALVDAAKGRQERKREIEVIEIEEELRKKLSMEGQDENRHSLETNDNLPDMSQM
ncbi:gamma-glutamyl-gamma-aminobutyrate hydrolase family protein [Thermococcus sp.]